MPLMEKDDPVSVSSQPMISVRDLHVKYGATEILHGVTFDVRRGETLVIMGGCGSGKSTLVRTLIGLEKPSSGHVWIKGKDVAAIAEAELDEVRKKIGMSFQGGALFGSMTVVGDVGAARRGDSKVH